MAAKKDVKLNFAENFLLSGIAAVTSKTCAAPIERVKLMVQNQDEMLKSGRLATPYKGVVDCATRILKEEGTMSFWRGNLANCLRYFPTQALNFAFKPMFKQLVGFKRDKWGYPLFMAGNICSGGLAGTASLFFVYSLDFARTRLANDAKGAKKGGAARQFNGLADVYTKIYKSDGILGLYRGFGISCAGIFVYRGFYFGLYDSVKVVLPSSIQDNFLANFLLGWVVTTTAGIMSYPIDTVRRRMMMSSGEKVKYTSSLGCAVGILKSEGVGSFFKGAGANILRGVAGAGVLAGFDVLKSNYIYYTRGV